MTVRALLGLFRQLEGFLAGDAVDHQRRPLGGDDGSRGGRQYGSRLSGSLGLSHRLGLNLASDGSLDGSGGSGGGTPVGEGHLGLIDRRNRRFCRSGLHLLRVKARVSAKALELPLLGIDGVVLGGLYDDLLATLADRIFDLGENPIFLAQFHDLGNDVSHHERLYPRNDHDRPRAGYQ